MRLAKLKKAKTRTVAGKQVPSQGCRPVPGRASGGMCVDGASARPNLARPMRIKKNFGGALSGMLSSPVGGNPGLNQNPTGSPYFTSPPVPTATVPPATPGPAVMPSTPATAPPLAAPNPAVTGAVTPLPLQPGGLLNNGGNQ